MEDITGSLLISAAREAVDALISQKAPSMLLGRGFDRNFEKLRRNLLETLLPLLRDAEDRKLRIREDCKDWLMDLKSVISGTQDVIDELNYEDRRRDIEVRSSARNMVRDFFSLSNPWAFRLKMVHKINEINVLIKKVCERAKDMKTFEVIEISSDNSEFVKRDREFQILKDMLLSVDAESNLKYGIPVIAIVGVPRVGKTTLAQLVYNDEDVVKYFGCRMMLTREHVDVDIERIVTELQNDLSGSRYLVVLDCVLNVDANQLKHMKNALLRMDGSEGSKVVITTGSVEVAISMRIPPSLVYRLDPLTEEDSWTVFKRIAFADGGPRETPSLDQVGRKILQRCKGIPIAITSLASLLYLIHDESAWISICDEDESSFRVRGHGLVEHFKPTFNRLPSPSVKQCFAYCAVFPKGHHIKKDELIQLWTNLGYLHPTPQGKLEEDVGNHICDVLMKQSLLEQVERDDYQNVTIYKIPDHIHDLAVHLHEGYRLTLEPNGRKYHTMADHLSLDFCEEKRIDVPKRNVDMLMALFPQIGVNVNRTLVLNLFGDDVEELPNSVRKFLRLRYLDLSETSITKLPKFVTKLYNLQTLKLPMDIKELPKQFYKLVSLRHFCMPNVSQTRALMPMKIGQLTCLQTLPFFVVGEGSGRSIEELGSLSNLTGSLHIYGLQLIKNKEEAEKAKISGKEGILEWGFHWYCEEVEEDRNEKAEGDPNASNQEDVLEGLQPPKEEVEGDRNEKAEEDLNASHQKDVLEGLRPPDTIRGLVLKKYSGRRFPSWMVPVVAIAEPLLQNLVKIELRNCHLCEHVPPLGHLKLLEIIEMVGFDRLQHIGSEFWGDNIDGEQAAIVFPALRKLTLDGMPNLNKWSLPAATSVFPCLEELYISGFPKLKIIPSQLFSFQELTISSSSPCDVESGNDVESGKKSHLSLTICSEIFNSVDMSTSKSSIKELLEKSSKSVVTNLRIRRLTELQNLPNDLLNLASLVKLEIIECKIQISDESMKTQFKGLTSLKQLSVKRCPNLTQLPEGLVQQTLVTLEIDSCRSLRQVKLDSLTSLQNLVIKGCPGLMNWTSKEKLLKTTSLQTLEIGAFSKELDYFPWLSPNPNVISAGNANVDSDIQPSASTSAFIAAAKLPQLTSFMKLTSLGLWGWEKLSRLPVGLQHLTTLTKLSIHSFHSLEALPDWLADLSSLKSLELHDCKNLARLPNERLLQLQQLTIGNCPLLGNRCGKRTGAEWAKISHIRSVKFSFSAEELLETVLLPEVN